MNADSNNNDESRSLIISDFRNLGITAFRKNEEERTILKINRCLEKDRLGGLVILLGSNNSGKSNVLAALTKFRKQEFDAATDRTDFISTPRKPRLELEVAGGRYGRIEQPKILIGSGRCKVIGTVPNVILYILRQKESYELFCKLQDDNGGSYVGIEEYMNSNEENVRLLCRGEGEGSAYSYIIKNRDGLIGKDLNSIIERLDSNDISDIAEERLEILIKGTPIDDAVLVGYENVEGFGKIPRYVDKDRLDEYNEQQSKLKRFAKKVSLTINKRKNDRNPNNDVIIADLSGGIKETELVPDAFSERYGYNISSRVYRYRSSDIMDSDMTCSPNNLTEFMTNVFSLLGFDNSSIVNTQYANYNIRVKLEEYLNKELESVSEKLNILLNSKDREYRLHIRLEENMIRLLVERGGNCMNLDHQSEGFKWLFAFFINFLMSKKFVPGDMVVIDEFGALLNFGTVAELSDLLRRFARENGITFIIATQNPMVIDIDHLDEIRMVVPHNDGSSAILNDFTEFGNGECTDILKPIVSSMTVGRNYLRTKNKTTVFVENHADYFYLSGFKNRLKGFDMDFIPIAGLTESTSAQLLSDALREMEHDPILLTNEDIHGPEDIDILKDNRVKVYTISEIFDDDKLTLTDLFTEEDRQRMGVDGASFDSAANLSWTIPDDDSISEETVDNFRRALDYISLE